MQQQNGYNLISEAFEGALITGLNMISLWMDYSNDRINGDIKMDVEPFNSFIMDPYFTKMDLSDCRYIIRRRYVTEREAKSLLPRASSDIDKLKPYENDGKFSYMVQSRRGMCEGLYAYDELWQKTRKKAKLLIDNVTGETRVWRGTRNSLAEFRRTFPWIETKTIYEPAMQYTVLINSEPMWQGDDPAGIDDYPFVPVVAYYEPQYDRLDYRLQGVVRAVRDAQEEYNKRRSKMVDILDSQVNSGWIVKENTVNNPQDLYRTGQGVVIETSSTAVAGDLQKIQSPEIPQSMFALTEELNKSIMEISGASEELMGVADQGNSEISGVLAKVRAYNSLTTLQDLFDRLNLSQKIIGQKIIKLIQNNWTPEKVQRITNREPTQEFYNHEFGKYDSVVREGMLTDTQRNMAYAQALQARNAGIPIPDSFIIDMLPIANKQELRKAYEQQEQQQQAQQQKMQEQEDLSKKLANAEVISRLSLADERRKRSVADLALARERVSESVQNRAQALLDSVKTVKEIQGMDQERFLNGMEFILELAERGAEQEQAQVESFARESLGEVIGTDERAEKGSEESTQTPQIPPELMQMLMQQQQSQPQQQL